MKVGGKISYSTCSLNPIEDEAVVAALLKQYDGCIALEKVELPGFKFRPGLKEWKFMVSIKDWKEGPYFNEYNSYEEVPAELKGKMIRETMFCQNYDKSILD